MAKASVLIHATLAISLLLSHPPSPRHTAIADPSPPPSPHAVAPPRPQTISIMSGKGGGGAGGGGRGALGSLGSLGASGKVSRELEALLETGSTAAACGRAAEKEGRGRGEEEWGREGRWWLGCAGEGP